MQPDIMTQTQPNEFQASEQESTAGGVSKKSLPEAFLYIVEAADSSEKIIGAFTQLEQANDCAITYAAQYGIPAAEIVDHVSSFGRGSCGPIPTRAAASMGPANASRKVWPNGTCEIRILGRSRLEWIKVMPKEFSASNITESTEDPGGTAYLAVDRSDILFVIGAYRSKADAWEACRKYWTQLSNWMPIEGETQWFDEQGMLHATGSIGNTTHHWCVEPYVIDAGVDCSGK
jgi:hypothetical protein